LASHPRQVPSWAPKGTSWEGCLAHLMQQRGRCCAELTAQTSRAIHDGSTRRRVPRVTVRRPLAATHGREDRNSRGAAGGSADRASRRTKLGFRVRPPRTPQRSLERARACEGVYGPRVRGARGGLCPSALRRRLSAVRCVGGMRDAVPRCRRAGACGVPEPSVGRSRVSRRGRVSWGALRRRCGS